MRVSYFASVAQIQPRDFRFTSESGRVRCN